MLNSRDGYIQPSYQACLSQVSGVTTSTTKNTGPVASEIFLVLPDTL